MRRSPSAAPRRSPSISPSSASSSASRSCASCSIPRRWSRPSSSCSISTRSARRATPIDLHDLLLRLGDLSMAEIEARFLGDTTADAAVAALKRERRVLEVTLATRETLHRHRGCRALSRRSRHSAAARCGRSLPAISCRSDRRSRPSLRAHARAIHAARRRASLRPRRRGHHADARAFRGARTPPRRRVPPRRHATRVVRERRAAHDSPPIAGEAAQRSGTGRSADPRATLLELAERHAQAPRARWPPRSRRVAAGLPDGRVDLRERDPRRAHRSITVPPISTR